MSGLQRRELTQEQINAGYNAGIITDEKRAGRPITTTYPIDDHPTEAISDRDDGIFVEAQTNNGGYRVHVTIADVAAHIPVHGPLGEAPYDRAYTRYMTGHNDTMFPKITEERMELVNGKERLGLQVSIDLDKHFQPTHTELKRVITYANAMSYGEAGKRMESDPHLRLMGHIAKGLKQYYFGESNPALDELDKQAQEKMNISPGEREAQRTVGTIMMLTNCVVPDIFAHTARPFPFRNFDGTKKNKDGAKRANYDTQPTKHEVVKKGDQARVYAHITSPLRRAPDFWAGHMMHYAIDVVDQLEDGLRKIYPEADKETLHYTLWQNIKGIMKYTHMQQDLKAVALACVKESGGVVSLEENAKAFKLNMLTRKIAAHPEPLNRRELQRFLNRVNALIWKEDTEQAATKRNMKLIARVEEYSANPMDHLSKDDFSQRLSDAAETGRLPTTLMDEALRRIHDNNFNRARDAYNVLLVAHYPHDERWLKLKRAICTAIKHDSGTVRNVFELAHLSGLLPDAQVFEVETTLRTHGEKLNRERPEVHAAIIITRSRDGAYISAPFYSIGHDPRSALSHARYSYLEHAAFGELQPVNQINMPNLFYAQLDLPKEEVLRKMIEKENADIDFQERTNKFGKPLCIVTVGGGNLNESIRVGDVGTTIEEARIKAISRMLRDDEFKYATRDQHKIEIGVVFPRLRLEARCKKAGYALTVLPAEEFREKRQVYFRSTVVLTPPYGPEERYTGQAGNIKNSVNEACVMALKSHEWQINFNGPERGWTTDVGKPVAPSVFTTQL